jgi:hypothetical protein
MWQLIVDIFPGWMDEIDRSMTGLVRGEPLASQKVMPDGLPPVLSSSIVRVIALWSASSIAFAPIALVEAFFILKVN